MKAAGCKKIFTDKMTGSRMDRPGWDQLLEYVRPGDVLVVAELSCMTRSLMHLLETAQALDRKQVNLVSLRENIDTNTPTGRTSAKARGKTVGRPRTDVVKLRDAKVLYDNSGKTAEEVCKVVGVGRGIFFA